MNDPEVQIRERAMALAISVYADMELAFLENDTENAEEKSRKMLLRLADDIYNFLKGNAQ